MRKHLYLLLVIVLLVGITLAGCSSSNEPNPGGQDTPAVETKTPAAESNYPDKAITVVCPWGAGGGTDVALRGYLQYMEQELGQPMIVVNKPGGAGAIAYTEAKDVASDGYNLIQVCIDFSLISALQTAPIAAEDFRFIAANNLYPEVIAVKGDAKWNSLEEFLEDARSRPGEISVGVTGLGNIAHITAVVVEEAADVEFSVVPFSQGDAEARAALLGGHIDFLTTTVSAVLPYVEDNSIKVLAVLDDQRSPALPDVPTAKELGYDAVVNLWRGLMTPAGTPDDIVVKLESAARAAFDNPEYAEWAEKTGVGHRWMPGAEFEEFVKDEITRYKAILEDIEL